MGFVIVVFSEAVHVVESWIVEHECLPEPLYLPLRCGFSSGIENMFNPMLLAECCESAWAIVAPELCSIIGQDLGWSSACR